MILNYPGRTKVITESLKGGETVCQRRCHTRKTLAIAGFSTEEGAKVRTRPAVGFTTHSGVPLNLVHFHTQLPLGISCSCSVFGSGPAVGTDGSQQRPGRAVYNLP